MEKNPALFIRQSSDESAEKALTILQRDQVAVDSDANLSRINAQLDQLGISRTLDAKVPSASERKIDMQRAEQALKRLNDDKIVELLRYSLQHHVTHLTFADLKQGLNQCCYDFNRWLLHQPEATDYAVVYPVNKSQQWVTSLALRYLMQLPSADCVGKHINSWDVRRVQDKNINTFVVFDDHSISGSQLANTVKMLYDDVVSEYQADQSVNIVLVVPYMTSKAIKRVNQQIESLQKYKKFEGSVNVKLITRFNIPLISELELAEEQKKLYSKLIYGEAREKGEDEYGLSHYALMFTDWKTLDQQSIPSIFCCGLLHYSLDKTPNLRFREPFISLLPEDAPPYKNSMRTGVFNRVPTVLSDHQRSVGLALEIQAYHK